MKTIGILGGGQLGSMLSDALQKLGCKVIFYAPEPFSPSFLRTPFFYQACWLDYEKLSSFFSECDIITYEFENVPTELLTKLQQQTGKKIFPSIEILKTTQNRILEKNFLLQHNYPTCQFISIENYDNLIKVTDDFPFPYIIKTAAGGYDGKGQWIINSSNELNQFIKTLTKENFVPLILEEKLSLLQEASCIVARNMQGSSVCFPIFDNIHVNNILHQTTLPSSLPTAVQEKIKMLALQAAQDLDVVGLLTTEFFITKKPSHLDKQKNIEDLYIYINEFAPRPHNSGHITQKSCNFSQFDALARVLLNYPLHSPQLLPGNYCMTNLLGETWLAQDFNNNKTLNLAAWKNFPEVIDITLYGKIEPTSKRKMGHFVTYSNDQKTSILVADTFKEQLSAKQIK
ncbi:5-(carboxyamino)imidazole ribonucleotide synthase [Spirobacillus cienkowskii]|uniref:5-(carboxyamino)imidazole ribonucleotide synthase n=1 Tax=Spirobacillus cienkowskii TaxID=495820 RepID=UPI0030D5E223